MGGSIHGIARPDFFTVVADAVGAREDLIMTIRAV